ncbi:PSD1 and planctomycete cytochrome C domain-containing protein [Rhodopirellula sp. MGV]|uniref:PSD1 and planctomycete cytochrome C domain-containing protein n=1 Tax=Rhodopirellula sp. MGV TaxID=2023130 RepID=UPI0013041E7A|nr:PSD1 and planctomycete cytochrome C domain-containing protein [Rhodopirellula sp. MGV]
MNTSLLPVKKTSLRLSVLLGLFGLGGSVGGFAGATESAVPDEVNAAQHLAFFENKVRPLLASKCVQCHGEEQQKGELRLDSIDAMTRGGESGAAVVPHKPQESLLVEAINYESFEMPPEKQLKAEEIEVLTQWVKLGAPWPQADSSQIRAAGKTFTDEDRNWWAIQPVSDPMPAGSDTTHPQWANQWAENSIDHFVAKRLEQAGLKPAAQADRHELVRRAYFDLHGLPPTPEQVDAFVNDPKPDAWPRLVKQLLQSPRYGERWAQHWLDVIRYAESDGYREDAFRPDASVFRDYVIRSFNNDKPFDQLIREHIAGDEISPDDPDAFIGTAYLRHGVYEWNQRDARMHWDLIVNEMTRVTGEAFLGIGIGCAQCHDHKFDPILQKDYFGLQAFLSSVSWPMDKPLADAEQIRQHNEQQAIWEKATKSIRDEIHELTKVAIQKARDNAVVQFPDDVKAIYHKSESEKTTYDKQLSYLVERQAARAARGVDFEKSLKGKPDDLKRYKELQDALKEFDSIKPKELPTAFIAVDHGPQPAPTYLVTRTSKTEVQPAFLELLGQAPPEIESLEHSTGRRTALANWIADSKNPLSTRVIVNRIWQRHFGTGIVPTPNDFGTLGELPSHPELLDWLTVRFLEGKWRIKAVHELIMMSATYQQTSAREPSDEELKVDPSNRLLWSYPPQRLDAEQVRDAMLAVSGELKQREGGASVAGSSPYRSVFVKKLRNKPDEMLGGFDAPLGFESAPDRVSTTTPLQSLLLINGQWSVQRSQAFAKRLLGQQKQASPELIQSAYRLVYGRSATDSEVKAALEFIVSQAVSIEEHAPLTVPKPKYPDENGLRPITQHFGNVDQRLLGDKALWIQPESRFERLRLKQSEGLADQFTVEAIVCLDRVYSDASVNTLLSRWDGNQSVGGWNIGITSKKSAYTPQNFIVQLVGRTFQDEAKYEVVASGLKFPLGKPVYIAAAISATASGDNPTSGTVTFYMKDLSDPDATLQSATVETDIVSHVQNPKLDVIAGGRQSTGHLWDGQMARLLVSDGVLTQEQLLVNQPDSTLVRLLDWKFSGTNGEQPAPNTVWYRPAKKQDSHGYSSKLHAAVTDFCHALFNSNEFLYLH